MTDTKVCPKCEGTMLPGFLRQVGNYGNSPFVWTEMTFHQHTLPAGSYVVRAYRCEDCAHVEMYAPAG
jgi:hypothetical protein